MVSTYNNISIGKQFKKMISSWPKCKNILDDLSSEGNLLIFGGAVRGFLLHGNDYSPRDIDIVVNTLEVNLDKYFNDVPFIRNRFGGYKLFIDDQILDIWSLKSTWAFQQNLITISSENLPMTVFLNFDSIVYDLREDKLYDKKFREVINTGVLDIILEENPFPDLNVLRSFIFREKYNLVFSNRLTNYIVSWKKYNQNPVPKLIKIQEHHYKTTILNPDEITTLINRIEY